ncbi:hypothetical protein EJM73_09205 [Clostridium botulinum]|uniref:hypothetical protein n=1 Tax=Clostridium botulinum TaxID=1491 RepID=UPI0013762CE7|nr:hypothetical protein [Clostridium botulinum]NCI19803.1 hypothetical protein [Clostridium botulinum]NCI35841.1 hypothetical protein [Clostridium botulinum]NCI71698.1 hypothetical protein [Clostridium botulinum]NDI38890.1 hypothetical protein [Clostridium botulinum]
MKIFVNKNLNKVLTESNYTELLKKESKEYNKSIEELKENDTDYKEIEIDIKVGDEDSLLNIDNEICNKLDVRTPLESNSEEEILEENKSISYKLTDNWGLNVIFDVIELDNEDLIKSTIKVTKIELA